MDSMAASRQSKQLPCFASCKVPVLPQPENAASLLEYAAENPAEATIYEAPDHPFKGYFKLMILWGYCLGPPLQVHQHSQAKPKKRSTKKAKKSVGKKKASFKRGCKAKKGKKAAKLGGKKGLSSAAASTRAPSTPDLEIPDKPPAVADHHSSNNEQEREAPRLKPWMARPLMMGSPLSKDSRLQDSPRLRCRIGQRPITARLATR